MPNKTRFRKILAQFYFNPKSRKVDQAQQFLSSTKQNLLDSSMYNFLHKKIGEASHLRENILDLCETMLETLSEKIHTPSTYNAKVQNALQNKMAPKADSIHNPKVAKLINYAIAQMEQSKDPFHDFSHIYRCLKLAKIYFGFYRLTHKLDWGTLVTAIVYHDISRANYLSFLYKNKYLKPFEYIPFLLDLSLVSNVLTDAERSAEIFIQKTQNIALPDEFVSNVIYGILGTSPSASKQKIDSIYFKIVCDIDKLDMFTIGRFESALRNVLSKKMANMRYFNRSNLLASFIVDKSRDSLNLQISMPLFDSFLESLRLHGNKFYPKDSLILS